MYTVVLMATLTGSAEAPDLFFSKWGHKYAACDGCVGSGDGHDEAEPRTGPLYSYGCAGGYGVQGYSLYGCHGCYGCYGCYGCAGASAGGYNPSQLPVNPKPGRNYDTLPSPKPEKNGGDLPPPNQATLQIEVPAGATVLVDDQPVKVATGSKSFSTPQLKPGETYYYLLTVVLKKEGRTLTETRKVSLRGGEVVKAAFTEDSVVAAANRPR